MRKQEIRNEEMVETRKYLARENLSNLFAAPRVNTVVAVDVMQKFAR